MSRQCEPLANRPKIVPKLFFSRSVAIERLRTWLFSLHVVTPPLHWMNIQLPSLPQSHNSAQCYFRSLGENGRAGSTFANLRLVKAADHWMPDTKLWTKCLLSLDTQLLWIRENVQQLETPTVADWDVSMWHWVVSDAPSTLKTHKHDSSVFSKLHNWSHWLVTLGSTAK